MTVSVALPNELDNMLHFYVKRDIEKIPLNSFHKTLHQHTMAPPSQLAIATSSINRLLKEETSYRTELNNQQSRLEKLLAGNGTNEDVENTEFQLRQEVCTHPSLRYQISGPDE